MSLILFKEGTLYKRSFLHSQFQGQEQGGISTPKNYPFIFIFSSHSGNKYGYIDRWENENIYSYTGEGRNGDMKFIRGNLAIKDHLKNGKRIFLFTYKDRSFVQFSTELELQDIGFFEGYDDNNQKRVSIKYFFKRVGVNVNYIKNELPIMVPNHEEIKKINFPTETERKGLVTSRVGQGAYRKSILYRWNFKCAVNQYEKPEILIASHIVPWKDSTDNERLDVDNGILLSPNYDALFDRNLISFENSGKIILSNALLNSKFQDLGITGKEIIKDLTFNNKNYLDRHRQAIT